MSAEIVDPYRLADLLGRPRPTPQQATLIAGDLEPTLVVAGAGSGKTETIAQRVVYLVANGRVAPGQVLGLTFTRKAAAELSARVRTRLRMLAATGVGDPAMLAQIADSQPMVGTYHAFAGQVIDEFGPMIGVEPAVKVLTATASWQLVRRIVGRWDGDLDTDRGPDLVTEDVLALTSALADHLVDAASLDAELDRVLGILAGAPPSARQRKPVHSDLEGPIQSLADRRVVIPLVKEYAAAKRAQRVVDFADQMQLAAEVVRRIPQVGAAMRERYPVVMLDEYQDTGHAQRVILRGLFGDPGGDGTEMRTGVVPAAETTRPGAGGARNGSAGAASWRGHPVTAVGDPVQSIYAWRGASASNLPRFSTDFPRRDGTPAPQRDLLVSFRNERRILDVANAVSAPVREAPVSVGVLRAPKGASEGAVQAALLDTSADEAEWLADSLSRLWQPSGDDTPGSTAAVLLRRRAAMAPIAAALRDRGLPVEIVGVGGLVHEPEVADLIAMMRLVVDHQSGPSAVRILTGARWRLGVADLAALARRARELGARQSASGAVAGPDEAGALAAIRAGLAEAVGDEDADGAGLVDAISDPGEQGAYSPAGWERIDALGAELRRLRGSLLAPLPDLLAAIERALQLDVEVLLNGVGRVHLDAFADVVADLAAEGAGPVELLDYLAAAERREDGLSQEEAEVATGRIQLLTVHAAKGLEWDIVAVPNLSAGVFPSKINSTWFGEAGQIPPSLRGDRDDIPGLDLPADADQGALAALLKAHRDDWGAEHRTEERRLFYVAVTRAKRRLLLSAYHWGEGRKTPAGPGPLFAELVDLPADDVSVDDAAVSAGLATGGQGDGAAPRRAGSPSGIGTRPEMARPGAGSAEALPGEALLGVPEVCAPAPQKGATNPLLGKPITAEWPADPLGGRRAAVAAGAALVEAARGDAATGEPTGREPGSGEPGGWESGAGDLDAGDSIVEESTLGPFGTGTSGRGAFRAGGSPAGEPGAVDDDPDGWLRDADLLLAERAERHRPAPRIDVLLEGALTVSQLVQLAADAEALAQSLHRPMPVAPAPQARRGTAFHAWLEAHFGGEPLLDLQQLPGAHDVDAADDAELADLIELFRASPWAARTPTAIEVPFLTQVAGVPIRGRIDAVFTEPDGSALVIDWKTGRVPGPEQLPVAATQLMAYRLAWARLSGLPLERVGAAFYYVKYRRLVTSDDLADPGRLEQLIAESTAIQSEPEPGGGTG